MEVLYVSAAICVFWLIWVAVFIKNELRMYHFDKKEQNTFRFVVWIYKKFNLEGVKWVKD